MSHPASSAQNLDIALAHIRARGVPVSIGSELLVRGLLQHEAGGNDGPVDLRTMAPRLTPILATNAREQAVCRAVFASLGRGDAPRAGLLGRIIDIPRGPVSSPAWKYARYILTALLVLAAIAAIIWALPSSNTASPVVVDGEFTPQTDPDFLVWLLSYLDTPLLIVLAMLMAVMLRRLNTIWRAHLESAPTVAAPTVDIASPAALPVHDATFASVARALHVVTPKPGRQLDEGRLAAQMARDGGLLRGLVWRSRPERHAFIALVDRRSDVDLFADLAHGMLSGLEQAGVPVERHDFSADPLRLRGLYSDAGTGQAHRLESLAARHENDTLLIFTAADGLLHVDAARGSVRFGHWRRAVSLFAGIALFSPFHAADWRGTEATLIEDGLTLFGPGRSGIAAFGQWFQQTWLGRQLPRPALPSRGTAYAPLRTSDIPVPEDIPAALKTLRRRLGRGAYGVLQDCAIHPSLSPGLTRFLLARRRRRGGADPVSDDAILWRLASLAWFREGHLPGWLRFALAQELEAQPERLDALCRDLFDFLSDRPAAGPQTALPRDVIAANITSRTKAARPGEPLRDKLLNTALTDRGVAEAADAIPQNSFAVIRTATRTLWIDGLAVAALVVLAQIWPPLGNFVQDLARPITNAVGAMGGLEKVRALGILLALGLWSASAVLQGAGVYGSGISGAARQRAGTVCWSASLAVAFCVLLAHAAVLQGAEPSEPYAPANAMPAQASEAPALPGALLHLAQADVQSPEFSPKQQTIPRTPPPVTRQTLDQSARDFSQREDGAPNEPIPQPPLANTPLGMLASFLLLLFVSQRPKMVTGDVAQRIARSSKWGGALAVSTVVASWITAMYTLYVTSTAVFETLFQATVTTVEAWFLAAGLALVTCLLIHVTDGAHERLRRSAQAAAIIGLGLIASFSIPASNIAVTIFSTDTATATAYATFQVVLCASLAGTLLGILNPMIPLIGIVASIGLYFSGIPDFAARSVFIAIIPVLLFGGIIWSLKARTRITTGTVFALVLQAMAWGGVIYIAMLALTAAGAIPGILVFEFEQILPIGVAAFAFWARLHRAVSSTADEAVLWGGKRGARAFLFVPLIWAIVVFFGFEYAPFPTSSSALYTILPLAAWLGWRYGPDGYTAVALGGVPMMFNYVGASEIRFEGLHLGAYVTALSLAQLAGSETRIRETLEATILTRRGMLWICIGLTFLYVSPRFDGLQIYLTGDVYWFYLLFLIGLSQVRLDRLLVWIGVVIGIGSVLKLLSISALIGSFGMVGLEFDSPVEMIEAIVTLALGRGLRDWMYRQKSTDWVARLGAGLLMPKFLVAGIVVLCITPGLARAWLSIPTRLDGELILLSPSILSPYIFCFVAGFVLGRRAMMIAGPFALVTGIVLPIITVLSGQTTFTFQRDTGSSVIDGTLSIAALPFGEGFEIAAFVLLGTFVGHYIQSYLGHPSHDVQDMPEPDAAPTKHGRASEAAS